MIMSLVDRSLQFYSDMIPERPFSRRTVFKNTGCFSSSGMVRLGQLGTKHLETMGQKKDLKNS